MTPLHGKAGFCLTPFFYGFPLSKDVDYTSVVPQMAAAFFKTQIFKNAAYQTMLWSTDTVLEFLCLFADLKRK